MQLLDGKIVRDKIAEELKAEIAKLDQKPELVIFQVGAVAESNTYIGQKVKFGEKIGAIVTHTKLPSDVMQAELVQQIQLANENASVTGIIVQLPIPDTLDKDKIIEAIDPKKDVDGQTARNIKLLVENGDGFVPATTKGVLTLLQHYKIPISGQNVVVVGRSTLVGKPTALAFLNADATVTIAHKKTQDLAAVCKTADILICAVGKVNLIGKEHVKEGQVIVDVGINVLDSGIETSDQEPKKRQLVGDVDFEAVKDIVFAISPVPGGAGPMTVASLFQNLMEAYKLQNA